VSEKQEGSKKVLQLSQEKFNADGKVKEGELEFHSCCVKVILNAMVKLADP